MIEDVFLTPAVADLLRYIGLGVFVFALASGLAKLVTAIKGENKK